MAGKGTCESFAILGLIKTMNDQFIVQAVEITPVLREIVQNINCQLEVAFHCWNEKLTNRDFRRIRMKLEALTGKIPMDRAYDITIFTSFALALLEDFSQKLQPRKRKAMCDLTLAVLRLHEYFTQHEDSFEHNLSGALSADAWQHELIQ
jgi:lipopolysaccharide biosynthesis glycosyltransferase